MPESGSWKKITIHTDGGCDGNPGPGGWAALLRYGDHVREMTGGEPATTNNRMELQAAIAALKSLKEPCEVTLFTDSEYLRGGITEWLPRWKANHRRTADWKPVKNREANAAGVTGPGFAMGQTHPPNCGRGNQHPRSRVPETR